MRDHLNKASLSSPARRHFLHITSAVASVATLAALSTSASAARLTPPPPPPPGRNAGCFLKGTHILTGHGLKRVETLSIGETSGAAWINTPSINRACRGER